MNVPTFNFNICSFVFEINFFSNIIFVRGVGYGTCVEVRGPLVKSIGPSQPLELQVEEIKVLGACDGSVSTCMS